MAETNKDISQRQIWFGILLVVILLVGYILADQIIGSINKNDIGSAENIGDRIDKIEKILSPYEKKNSMKKITLVENFSNTAKNNIPTSNFKKAISRSGEIADGYLYINASVEENSLTNYDGVYVKLTSTLNGKVIELGGHLIKSKSLETPRSGTSTELLFALNDIKYKNSYQSSELEVVSGDWLKLLNDSNSNVVIGFSSTERKGKLLEASIYYDCKEDSICNLTTN